MFSTNRVVEIVGREGKTVKQISLKHPKLGAFPVLV
jgi:hypothetical protein